MNYKRSSKVDGVIKSSKLLERIISELISFSSPGLTKLDIQNYLLELLSELNTRSATKGLNGFCDYLCLSVNEEVLFGRVDNRVLSDGDIVTIDLTIEHEGYFADKAVSFVLGPSVKQEYNYLINAAGFCIESVVKNIKPGMITSDIGDIISSVSKYLGLHVIKEFGGHGVGLAAHTFPFIPNFRTDEGYVLSSGLTFTVEPILLYGGSEYNVGLDGVVRSKFPSVHVEETILVTDRGLEVIT
jgi:methionyl aminopeptidase